MRKGAGERGVASSQLLCRQDRERARRQFTDEFKAGAVGMVLDEGTIANAKTRGPSASKGRTLDVPSRDRGSQWTARDAASAAGTRPVNDNPRRWNCSRDADRSDDQTSEHLTLDALSLSLDVRYLNFFEFVLKVL